VAKPARSGENEAKCRNGGIENRRRKSLEAKLSSGVGEAGIIGEKYRRKCHEMKEKRSAKKIEGEMKKLGMPAGEKARRKCLGDERRR
jgi:hypothetical protein